MLFFRRFAYERLNTFAPKTLIASGLVLIGLSFLWPLFPALHNSMSAGRVDFIRGFLIGIGCVCGLMGIGALWGERSRP
jgi:hypothetical protein